MIPPRLSIGEITREISVVEVKTRFIWKFHPDDNHQKHMPGNFIFVNSSRRLQKSRILGVISSLARAMKPTQFFAPITLIASDVISVCSIRTAPHLSKYSSRTLVLELTSLKILCKRMI